MSFTNLKFIPSQNVYIVTMCNYFLEAPFLIWQMYICGKMCRFFFGIEKERYDENVLVDVSSLKNKLFKNYYSTIKSTNPYNVYEQYMNVYNKHTQIQVRWIEMFLYVYYFIFARIPTLYMACGGARIGICIILCNKHSAYIISDDTKRTTQIVCTNYDDSIIILMLYIYIL